VGYGVDERIAGGGYFVLRNSWGPKFADKGYAKITFEYARKYGIDAYAVSVR
jgi:C1A family cysteine protease